MPCRCPSLKYDQAIKSRASEEVSWGHCVQHAGAGGHCNLKWSRIDEEYGTYIIQAHLLEQLSLHYTVWELLGDRVLYLATVLASGPEKYGAIVNQLGRMQHYLSLHPEIERTPQAVLNWVIDIAEESYRLDDLDPEETEDTKEAS